MAVALTITVDRDRCVGAGMCALTAPAVFDQGDEDGRVVLLYTEPASAHHAAAHEAADLCPAAAITAIDTTTHQQGGKTHA
ncbi:ferredoxin [Streptomyces maoxianensis]|uniref:Ferredoxin n=1 Tax=Streptomyces maoxianensis TaxID=1459942 RepID=A0ABV9G457_9ACTN